MDDDTRGRHVKLQTRNGNGRGLDRCHERRLSMPVGEESVSKEFWSRVVFQDYERRSKTICKE